MPRITAGQKFDTLADFKTQLRAWAVEEGFSPAILDSDAKRVRVGCRTARDCPFRIRCNFDPVENKARVSTIVAVHTCQDERELESSSVIRGEVTKLRFLVDAVPQLMIVDHGTHTKDIIENVKNRYGQVISMRQAQKVKATLLAMAADELGKDLYDRMKQKLGEDATDEEMRRGKRLRMDHEALDPALRMDGDLDDYQDYDLNDDDEDGHGGDHVDGEDPSQESHHAEVIDSVSRLEAGVEEVLDHAPRRSAADLRAEAATLFQQASKKFQEATQLHMQASKLFSQAAELEDQTLDG